MRVPGQYSTPDGYELIHRLQRLRARGGGDCPEYALTGTLPGKTTKIWPRTGLVFWTSNYFKWYINKLFTLQAVNMSLPGSTVYVFTDADANDRSQASSVVQEAKKRDVNIQFLLTGTCSTKRRSKFFEFENISFYFLNCWVVLDVTTSWMLMCCRKRWFSGQFQWDCYQFTRQRRRTSARSWPQWWRSRVKPSIIYMHNEIE